MSAGEALHHVLSRHKGHLVARHKGHLVCLAHEEVISIADNKDLGSCSARMVGTGFL